MGKCIDQIGMIWNTKKIYWKGLVKKDLIRQERIMGMDETVSNDMKDEGKG